MQKGLAAVALLAAGFLLYLPSDLSVSLTIPPDSSEYSIGLVNLLEHGRFGFTLNGLWYPSMYPPWFSVSCLIPAYLLSGGDALCLYWSVLLFALILLVLLYKIGRVLGLGGWALVPPVLVMLLPDFVFYSRVVMTEVPYVALFAAGALLFLSFCIRQSIPCVYWLAAGMLVTWSGMVRSTGLPMLLPFAILLVLKGGDLRFKIKAILLLFLPVIAYEVSNLAYNWFVFGSPLRSGYQFWLPVPYDYPSLLFNISYVSENIQVLIGERVIQATLCMLALLVVFSCIVLKGRLGGTGRNRRFLALFGYLLFQLAVLAILYMGFHWVDSRFYLAITICLIPLFFYFLNEIVVRCIPRRRSFLLSGAGIACVVVFSNCPTRYGYLVGPRMWNFRENMVAAEVLPSEAVVVKSGDPNVMDHFAFRERKLTLFPLVREFDYVSRMVAPASIRERHDPPSSWRQGVIEDLVKNGVCKLPFPFVFAESPGEVRHFLEKGKRVFLQEVIGNPNEKIEIAAIDQMLKRHGMRTKAFGSWTVPATKPNPIRHFYDIILLKGFSMDAWPEVTVAYYEIVLAEDEG